MTSWRAQARHPRLIRIVTDTAREAAPPNRNMIPISSQNPVTSHETFAAAGRAISTRYKKNILIYRL